MKLLTNSTVVDDAMGFVEEGKKVHEFQADHGFRKWFKTRCETAGMRSINLETLMSHLSL
jgi:hypothetical protein